jgi:hypothetical protein
MISLTLLNLITINISVEVYYILKLLLNASEHPNEYLKKCKKNSNKSANSKNKTVTKKSAN